MTLAHAMWIHGNSLQVEGAPDPLGVVRTGFSARCAVPHIHTESWSYWFHFAIPTPVIVDNKRLRVGSVLVRFRTLNTLITAIHVYDGENKIAVKEWSGLRTWDRKWSSEKVEVPGNPEILWGLGISILVEFPAPDILHFEHFDAQEIEFSAAGCDFL